MVDVEYETGTLQSHVWAVFQSEDLVALGTRWREFFVERAETVLGALNGAGVDNLIVRFGPIGMKTRRVSDGGRQRLEWVESIEDMEAFLRRPLRAVGDTRRTEREGGLVTWTGHGTFLEGWLQREGEPGARDERGEGSDHLRLAREMIGLLLECLASECRASVRSVNERWERQIFIHDAAHGVASVESSIIGLLRRLARMRSHEDVDDGMKAVSRYADSIKREYAAHRWSLLRLAKWYADDVVDASAERNDEWVDVAALVEELIVLYRDVATARNIELVFDVDSAASDRMPLVRGEENALRRALHNVLVNAIKYSFASVALDAKVTRRFVRFELLPTYARDRTGRRLECAVSVANYGLPIHPTEIARVTHPRYRGSAAIGENIWGSGLGLFETERIMRASSGRIRIKSSTTEGSAWLTKVWLIFPSKEVAR